MTKPDYKGAWEDAHKLLLYQAAIIEALKEAELLRVETIQREIREKGLPQTIDEIKNKHNLKVVMGD